MWCLRTWGFFNVFLFQKGLYMCRFFSFIYYIFFLSCAQNGRVFVRFKYCNVFTLSLCHSEGSLHSSDSVSDSSPPPAVVQTGVPTQVVQQVQTAQQVKYARTHKNEIKTANTIKMNLYLQMTAIQPLVMKFSKIITSF